MSDADRVEEVARGLAGIVVAQVDGQADADRLFAFQCGHIVVDGQHERRAQVACHRNAQRVGTFQHLFRA